MKKTPHFLYGPYGMYVRTLLEFRMDRLRQHARQRELGASAIELAIITAIIGLVALTLALVIKHVVTSNSNKIQNLSNP